MALRKLGVVGDADFTQPDGNNSVTVQGVSTHLNRAEGDLRDGAESRTEAVTGRNGKGERPALVGMAPAVGPDLGLAADRREQQRLFDCPVQVFARGLGHGAEHKRHGGGDRRGLRRGWGGGHTTEQRGRLGVDDPVVAVLKHVAVPGPGQH